MAAAAGWTRTHHWPGTSLHRESGRDFDNRVMVALPMQDRVWIQGSCDLDRSKRARPWCVRGVFDLHRLRPITTRGPGQLHFDRDMDCRCFVSGAWHYTMSPGHKISLERYTWRKMLASCKSFSAWHAAAVRGGSHAVVNMPRCGAVREGAPRKHVYPNRARVRWEPSWACIGKTSGRCPALS